MRIRAALFHLCDIARRLGQFAYPQSLGGRGVRACLSRRRAGDFTINRVHLSESCDGTGGMMGPWYACAVPCFALPGPEGPESSSRGIPIALSQNWQEK